MQKEAYLASLSAAATHHNALYGINATSLPPFLDNTQCSPHGISPFSLVKQEPRELSYPEKAPKQSIDRRTGGFKPDLDINRGSREIQPSLPASMGNPQSFQIKESKLSPSITNGTSSKLVTKGINLSASTNSTSQQNLHKSSRHMATNSSSSVRHNSETVRSKCISPSNKQTSQSSSLSRSTVNSSSKRSVSKTSLNASKHTKSASLGHASSASSNASLPSSTILRSEAAVVSVPTHPSAPIPLATVQHDGVVLSALASPSSAAASLASIKPAVLKQQVDSQTRTSSGDKEHADNGQSVSEANTSSGLSLTSVNFQHTVSESKLGAEENRQTISCANKTSYSVNSDQKDKPKVLCDDGSDIIVDSTENDDYPDTARSPNKSDQDRAIEETIEIVASGGDSFTRSGPEAAASPQSVKTSTDASMTSTLLSVTRTSLSCVVTSSGTSSNTRTIYAKTQSVPSVTVSGCVQLSSSITKLASASALPYYHTLYSKPQGVKRVHATTFVPEVGVFKGPSIKTVRKTSSSPLSSGNRALSPEIRSRLDPRLVLNIQSLPSDSHCRVRDSSRSPSLWSPSRDLVSHSSYSLSASPGIAHTTTEISSSLDSVSLDSTSVRSQSVASFRSVPEGDGLDDTSDEIESDAAVDHNTFNDPQKAENGQPTIHTDCNIESTELGDFGDDDDDNEEEGDEDEHLPKENNSVLDEDDYFSVSTTPVDSSKEFMPIIESKTNETYDIPRINLSSAKPLVSLDSRVNLAASALSAKRYCDTAIDYSLPKLSGPGNSSTSHASCSVNPSSSSTSTRIVSSAARAFTRYESSGLLADHFLCNPSPSHRRLKRNPDYCRLQVFAPTSQDVVHKVRGLKKHGDGGVKRCESAPPIASRPFEKNLKGTVLASPNTSNEREFHTQDKSDSCVEHCLGNNIPVGIAVAQIRRHHGHQPK
ncbi:unnamed protein product, partial [Candidula unifasciata]